MVESSEAAMLIQVGRAIDRKEPIVFLGWEPHPMNKKYAIRYLSGGDDFFGPNYGQARVLTVTAPDYASRCANVAHLLNNLQFTLDMENTMMESILDNAAPVDIAKAWIKQTPQSLDHWLDGVNTFDGKDGKAAVRHYLGL